MNSIVPAKSQSFIQQQTGKSSFAASYLQCRLACSVGSLGGLTNSPPNRESTSSENHIEQRFPSDPEQTLNKNNCSVVINCDYLQATGTIYDPAQIGSLKKLIESQYLIWGED